MSDPSDVPGGCSTSAGPHLKHEPSSSDSAVRTAFNHYTSCNNTVDSITTLWNYSLNPNAIYLNESRVLFSKLHCSNLNINKLQSPITVTYMRNIPLYIRGYLPLSDLRVAPPRLFFQFHGEWSFLKILAKILLALHSSCWCPPT